MTALGSSSPLSAFAEAIAAQQHPERTLNANENADRLGRALSGDATSKR